MARTNLFFQTLPFEVASSLAELGKNLKTARKRRKLSARQVAEKLGVEQRSVLDAEKGKPTTAISTYVGLFWVYDLLDDIREMAAPTKDTEGLRLAAAHEKKSIKSELDNDF
jgi:transcriptional regulator with XRE-family HTH domain